MAPSPQAEIGIDVEQAANSYGDGAVNIHASTITSGGDAVHVVAWTAPTIVAVDGAINAGGDGFYTTSTSGNITQTANGAVNATSVGLYGASIGAITQTATAAVTAGSYGIDAVGFTGDIAQTGAAVTSTGASAFYATSTTGNIAQTANGAVIAGVDGFYAVSDSGNLAVTANSTTNAATDGVYAVTAGAGTVTVTNNGAVTAGAYGVYTSAAGGATLVNVNADVNNPGAAASVGVETHEISGNATVNIASGVTVSGGGWGVTSYQGTGTTTVNNAGLITTADPAAATIAYSNYSGNSVVNNTGTITGAFYTPAGTATINNASSGVINLASVGGWGSNATPNTTFNNSGLINVGEVGTNVLTWLNGATVNNQSGGVIDMATHTSAMTDQGAGARLAVTNFSAQSGSAINFVYNANAANSTFDTYDNSANGKGEAGTIDVLGKSTPLASSKINFTDVGGATTALTGAVAVVYTGVDKSAPAAGATLTPSSFYTFGLGNPSTGKTVYTLVDDGNGGVYLEWRPNLSSSSLAGYGGGGGAGGGNALSDPNAAATHIAVAGAGFSGIGGFDPGQSSGAFGQVTDAAANAAGPSSPGGSTTKGPLAVNACGEHEGWNVWGADDASGSSFHGSGSGGSSGELVGLDRDLSTVFGQRCGRVVAGVFGVAGGAHADWATGSTYNHNEGGGAYLRASTELGFYATVLGAVTSSTANMTNAVYGSTASQGSLNTAVVGAVGYVYRLSWQNWFDSRAFVAHGDVDGRGFTDSVGIMVNSSHDGMTTVGLSEGYNQAFSDRVTGFVRGGVKWTTLDSSITAFGDQVSGVSHATFGTVETGLFVRITPAATLTLAAAGDFNHYASSGAGHVGLNIRF